MRRRGGGEAEAARGTHVLIAMMDGVAWKALDDEVDDEGMDLETKALMLFAESSDEGEEKRRGRRIILWRGILA